MYRTLAPRVLDEPVGHPGLLAPPERDFFIDNLLVRNHFIIVMIRWTGLAPWEFEFPCQGSLTSGLGLPDEGDSMSAARLRALRNLSRCAHELLYNLCGPLREPLPSEEGTI